MGFVSPVRLEGLKCLESVWTEGKDSIDLLIVGKYVNINISSVCSLNSSGEAEERDERKDNTWSRIMDELILDYYSLSCQGSPRIGGSTCDLVYEGGRDGCIVSDFLYTTLVIRVCEKSGLLERLTSVYRCGW